MSSPGSGSPNSPSNEKDQQLAQAIGRGRGRARARGHTSISPKLRGDEGRNTTPPPMVGPDGEIIPARPGSISPPYPEMNVLSLGKMPTVSWDQLICLKNPRIYKYFDF